MINWTRVDDLRKRIATMPDEMVREYARDVLDGKLALGVVGAAFVIEAHERRANPVVYDRIVAETVAVRSY